MSITEETRRESYENLDSATIKKCIVEMLKDGSERTAREIGMMMYGKADRQAVAPRLTELATEGIVEAVDKKKDIYTGRTVAVYRLVKK